MGTMRVGRREFLRVAGAGAVGVAALGRSESAEGQKNRGPAAPVMPAVKLNVKDYGATGDGKTKDTRAIQMTIDRCSAFGGGEVVVPAGTFLTGGIELRSHVMLRLEKDAVLKGSAELTDYLVGQVRWEGKWIQGYLGLVSARDAEQTGIVGPGLGGNAMIQGAHETGGRPTKDQPLRHPCLVEPIGCKGVHLEGFSTDYFRMWSIHPTNCEDVTITGLTIRSTGGNGDGIDIDSTRRVKIDKCDIATGDDCISIKSGRGAEAFKLLRTSEDIEITNCTFADSIFACIGIGSETSGGIRNVRISHCKFTGAKAFAVYIKSRPGRGAFIEDISVDDVDVSGCEGGFLRLNMANSGIQDEFPVGGAVGIPTTKNFKFTNVRVKDVPVLIDGMALPAQKPLDGLVLENITGTCGKGIFLANVDNARIKDVVVTDFAGRLLNLANVRGKGLESALLVDPPKALAAVEEKAYTLR